MSPLSYNQLSKKDPTTSFHTSGSVLSRQEMQVTTSQYGLDPAMNDLGMAQHIFCRKPSFQTAKGKKGRREDQINVLGVSLFRGFVE